MDIRTIDVGPVELSLLEAGAGGFPLMLVHGFTGAKEDFADFVDRFATAGFHVVAPDNRGHGASSQPEDEVDYSLSQMAGDVIALADKLGWRRYALLGHSMGGMVVQLVAMADADRLASLVLMDTGHGPVEGIEPSLAALAIEVARTQGMAALHELSQEHDAPLSSSADARVRAQRPGYVEFGERKFKSCSPAMYASMATELLAAADRLSRLAALDVPTLVVVGEEDHAFVGPSQRMADAIPAARQVVIADAGHSPQFEAPDAWWDALLTFLAPLAEG